MSSIFISYRRVGALVHARALFERLRHEFGANEVFIDLEGVDFGLDFVDILNEQLNGCQVMLAVIDPQWATAVDRQGLRRIDREFDYVRTEIVTALRRGIRTVPVLIDGAEMPDGSDLPEPLRALTRRNALILDFNRFDAEISRLIGIIRKILAAASAEARVPVETTRLTSIRIKIIDSVGPSQEVELGEDDILTLGRGAGNVVALMDPHVSARHAEVFVRGGRIWVRDLGSSNGVYVNGRRIAQVEAIDHISVVHLSHDGPAISVLADRVAKTVPD